MSGLLATFASPAISSLVGAVGGIVGKISDNKKELKIMEFTFSHEQAMEELANTRATLELQNKKDVALIEADTKKVAAELNALVSSYNNDAAKYSNVEKLSFVDKVRGMTRPVITGTLTGYMIILTSIAIYNYGVNIPQEQIGQLIFLLVDTIANLASLSVSWWFGSRVTVTKQ